MKPLELSSEARRSCSTTQFYCWTQFKNHTKEKELKNMKETTEYFCCLLCHLVKAGPGCWSEPDRLFAQQFILDWASWANSVHLWVHTAIPTCLSSAEWVGRLAGRHPWHRRHPKQARKTQLMPTLSWERPSPLQWIHCEHQTLSPRGTYLEPPTNSDSMQTLVWAQARWGNEWSSQGCKPSPC